MRRLIAVLFAIFMLVVQIPALGAETAGASGKDLCLLYSQNCPNQSLSYQEKIARFKEEINKGTEVYTAAELQRLNDKLQEAETMYNDLVYSPSNHMRSRGHR